MHMLSLAMTQTKTDWVEVMRRLGPEFATRTAGHDEDDSFVAENYASLKEAGAFAAGVPSELGGGGASHSELCAMVRELAHHCASTALAFSMHTHLVAAMAYAWRSGNPAPETMLRRVAAEKLVLVSTGGSDWLMGSGKLEKVDGGFRLTGRKIFASGVPAGDVLMTTGVYDDPEAGATVIHFALPIRSEGVKILDTWKVLGMRGTGSHDVEITGALIPDAATKGVRRPVGKWHPFMHMVALVALPVFNAAYLGLAEKARDTALGFARRKKDDPSVPFLVGEMENLLISAQLAHASMVEAVLTEKPGPAVTASTFSRRTIFVNAATATVQKALEVAGGPGFYRAAGIERAYRDIQAARYHPLPEKPQTRLTGRVLLGLDIDG
jgi:alkylation response protein AidB-like acyl-CoA dehydrogenase